MKVGQTTEISVLDVTPAVVTDNATPGGTLEHTRIEQLPINGRNVMTLLQTVPGIEGTGRAFGIRDGSFDAVFDGSTLTDRLGYGLGSGTGNGARITYRQPGLDSIQEFTVENNNASAKCSRPTCIVMTTKGGTNQIHGSAFETNRNNEVGLARSRTDYYTKPPFLNRNEFGVRAGGPVYIPKAYNGKNKTFWFFSYEGLRNISASTQGYQVPTPAMRYGYIYERPARKHFRWWHNWAVRSRLPPMIEVARMLKRRFENIITYLKHGVSNATSESINAKIQWVKYTARGFRNKENFVHAIYFHCGGLDLTPEATK